MSTPLLSADEVAALRSYPRWRPVAQAAANVGIYAGLACVAATQPFGWLLWPVMGFVLAGCYAAVHDCWHNNHLPTKRANRIAGLVWSALVLKHYTYGQVQHFVHHRYTRTDGDNEPRFVFRSVGHYLDAVFHRGMIRTVAMSLSIALAGAMPPGLASASKQRAARLDARVVVTWLAIAIALTVAAPRLMLLAYWGPMLMFSPMVVLIALPEHHGCRDHCDAFGSTRTTTSNALTRLLIWNSNFHLEHHLFPSVPSYNLARVHRVIRPQIEHLSPGYLRFHTALVLETARRTTPSRRSHRAQQPREQR